MNNINPLNELFNTFTSQAFIGCGLSDTLYAKKLNSIIDNYISKNEVTKEFMERAEQEGYDANPVEYEDDESCSHGITYGCCPAGCEDPSEIQKYEDNATARLAEMLIDSDERNYQTKIALMVEVAKLNCGVFEDMVELLINNNKMYDSEVLGKRMPDFSDLWSEVQSTAFFFNEDMAFTDADIYKHLKNGFYQYILDSVSWADVYIYFNNINIEQLRTSTTSDLEIAFYESIYMASKKQFSSEQLRCSYYS